MIAQFSDSYPPRDFVKKLIALKKQKLAANRKSVEHLFQQDLIIKIYFEDYKPQIWRRVRVSGGIPLNIFHDKVLGPAIGWAQNYHGYKFTDFTDGAAIGPVNSAAIDMMHIDNDGTF